MLQLLKHFRREMMVGNIENKDDMKDTVDDTLISMLCTLGFVYCTVLFLLHCMLVTSGKLFYWFKVFMNLSREYCKIVKVKLTLYLHYVLAI